MSLRPIAGMVRTGHDTGMIGAIGATRADDGEARSQNHPTSAEESVNLISFDVIWAMDSYWSSNEAAPAAWRCPATWPP
jgi:hypothetical protein